MSIISTSQSALVHTADTSTAASSNASAAAAAALSSTASAASTGSSTASTSSASSTTSTVSKDEFLKLLVAQLQHQDPLSPQDPTAFVTQLAQFSALEQSTQTNQQLASLTSATGASQRLEMASLVGHGATAKTTQVAVQGAPAVPATLSVHLPSNATGVTVQITDASGAVVRTIDLGARTAGDIDTSWLGMDGQGRPLAPGTYGVKVTATGAGNTTLDAYAEVSGTVTAVDFGASGTQLRIAGSPVTPSDIISVQK